MQIKSIGIIGFGSMGELIAKEASKYLSNEAIKIVETKQLPNDFDYSIINFSELKNCDLIIPAVSAKNLETVACQLEKLELNGQQIICSISATMTYAEKILRQYLANSQIILTHPLFGPASFKQNHNSLQNLEVVFCLNYCRSTSKAFIRNFFTKVGLKTHEVSPVEHDQIMSKNHLIPFMLSHILKDYDFIKSDFHTKSFNELTKFLDHTSYNPEVLDEIVTYNPYAWSELENFNTLLSKYSKRT